MQSFDSHDQLPPQNLEAEEEILGGILLDHHAMGRIEGLLKKEHFYDSIHGTIYAAAASLHAKGRPTDLMSMTSWLQDHGELEKIGGTGKLGQLVSRTVSAVNIDRYAELILEKYARRQLIDAGHEISSLGYEVTMPLEESFDSAEKTLFEVTQSVDSSKGRVIPADEVARAFYANLEATLEGTLEPSIPTGFIDLDKTLGGGLSRQDLIIVAGRPSMGKCLGKGTLVLMFDGSLKPVEEVVVGDRLMGPDSKPRNVLSLARGREMMYWVRQKRGGIDYRVNESHILSLKHSGRKGRYQHGEVKNLSVKEFLSYRPTAQSRLMGYKVPVNFPYQPVPIDPYILGVWLGDGSCGTGMVTTPDPEIELAMSLAASRDGYEMSNHYPKNRCKGHSLCATDSSPGLRSQLRSLGILKEKRIPQQYLRNDTATRLQLLAGLLDTDGNYHSGCYEITQKSEELARQIKFLADTLGFKTSINEKIGRIASRNFEGLYFRVYISGNVSEIPCRIERKKAPPNPMKRDWRVTGIKVEPDCVDDYYGFEIDGDRLFLLEDMTVTHNTALTLNVATNIAKSGKPVLIFSLEMSNEQLFRRMVSTASRVPGKRIKSGELSQQDLEAVARATCSLSELPIHMSEASSITLNSIRSDSRALQAKAGELGAIIVDYLQLMGGNDPNQNYAIGAISRGLKQLARELDVPVIALSQLSRGVESRANKRPMQSDLRDSGSIEQDSNVIIALYRDDYYNPDTPDQNIVEAGVIKSRDGETGIVRLFFDGATARFENLAQNY